jgi:MFS family permease
LVQRALVALVQVLALAVWFSTTAAGPALRLEMGIGTVPELLTSAVQVGFVIGAVLSSLSGLADRFPAHRVVGAAALTASGATLATAWLANDATSAVLLRLCTGVALAAVYPVGMKLMASWAPSHQRGRSLGVLIGALTLGSGLPHLIAGAGALPWRGVLEVAALLAATAGVVSLLFLRPGPHLTASSRPRIRWALEGLRQRRPRLVNLGYFGHMWELYAWWTWLSAFVAAALATHHTSAARVSLVAFAVIGVSGAAGAVLGGWAADRYGRPQAASTAMLVSGGCCLLSPLLFRAAPAVLIGFLLVWGAAVIADSGVFSAALSEVSDQRYVGTALTMQTAVGFTLTVISIQLVRALAEPLTWQYVWLVLAPGPLLGAVAMKRFQRSAQDSDRG